MKKIMILALMVLGTTCAFAGDSDALKAIKKAKDFNEAQNLVMNSLGQLANDAEKAAAYNKLVDLAMDKFTKESTNVTWNQTAAQMGQETKPVDEAGMNEAAYNAVMAAMECDKYDQKPNEKGKVAPKFAAKNAQRAWQARQQLVNAGQDALNNENQAEAKKFWGLFVDSDSAPLFKDCDRTFQQPFFGQVARFAAIFAYQDKDMATALRYCDVAVNDPAEAENALALKLEILGADLKNHEDSVKYLANVKELFKQHSDNATILEKVYNMYMGMGDKAAALSFLDDVLAKNPNNFVALADKGMYYMDQDNAAEAAKYLKQAIDAKEDNAVVHYYYAICVRAQAQAFSDADPAKFKSMMEEAIKHFDRTKELDPDKMIPWGYNRWSAYSQLYGEDDAKTKAAEADK